MEKLWTPKFRVAFPNVFVAVAPPGSEKKKYSVTMLFTPAGFSVKDKELWVKMKKSAEAVAIEKWPKGMPKNLVNPFKDGMEKQEYDGYGAGVIFLNASTQQRPGLVDGNKVKIEDASEFYGGCYAVATINAYAWEFMGKCGVSFGLQNLQKVGEGEPFGGKTRAEDDFSATDTSQAEDTSGLFA